MNRIIKGLVVAAVASLLPLQLMADDGGDSGGSTPAPTSDILSQIYQQMVANTNAVKDVKSTLKSEDDLSLQKWDDFFKMLTANKLESGTEDGTALLLNNSGYASVSQLDGIGPIDNRYAQNLSSMFCSYVSSTDTRGVCSSGQVEWYSAYSLIGPASYDTDQTVGAEQYIGNAVKLGFSPGEFQLPITNGFPANTGLGQYIALSAAGNVMNDIKQSRLALGKDKPSEMKVLNDAVTAPFNEDWFKRVGKASNEQVLRSIAIMMAINNYVQYRQMQQQQATNVLLANQLIQLANQKWMMTKLDNDISKMQSR